MAGGWVKLHRQIIEWGWYKCDATRGVFIHLLLTANHKDGEVEGVPIRKGQRATSTESLASDLGLSRQSVRTAIKHLKSTNEITTQSTSKFTIITVVNYAKYQGFNGDKEEGDNQQLTSTLTNELTSNQPAFNQRLTTNKNGRMEECKKVKKREYGPFVHLTEAEYQKIVETVGEEGAAWCIEQLSAYKEANGKTYSSDMGAMRKWVFGAWEKQKRGTAADAKTKPSDRPSARYVEQHDEDEYKRFEISSMSELRERNKLVGVPGRALDKENG